MLPFYSKAQKKKTQKFIIKLGLESRSIVSWDGIVSIVPYNLYAEKLDKNIIAAYHKRQSFIQGIWSYRNKGIPAENRLKSHHKKILWRNNITFITRKLGFMFSFCHSGTHHLLANPKDIIEYFLLFFHYTAGKFSTYFPTKLITRCVYVSQFGLMC